jgi:multidrug efflux pump
MEQKQWQFNAIVLADPAVRAATSSVGGGAMNTGQLHVHLKPLSRRNVTADQVIQRLRQKLSSIPGARLFLQADQDIRVGGRQSNSQYQFTLES